MTWYNYWEYSKPILKKFMKDFDPEVKKIAIVLPAEPELNYFRIENDIKEVRLSTLKKIVELGLGGKLQLSIEV